MENFRKENMTTMTGIMNKLQSDGYTENFVASEKGLEAPSKEKFYIPSEVTINNFYRFEGESDPGDNAIVYAVEANDGTKGMVVDSYGSEASHLVSKFITEVESITKKEPHSS
ncbi:hypothetical protein CNR22_14190 [Sphingobacteriaceae bacterium]|nr:hypothetical protein CNR22_14190 [Sphingobacteriaceae bacterium]